MACQVFGWLQRTIGLDITGETEFQQNQTTAAQKREDATSPPPPGSKPAPPNGAPLRCNSQSPRRHQTVQVFSPRRQASSPAATGGKLLAVDPPALYFPPPLDRFINTTLTLHNKAPHFVAFKLKATTPARYSVKVRQGVLGPREQLDIGITLIPMKAEPRKLRDKFLVQCLPLAPNEVFAYQASGDLQGIWQQPREEAVERTKVPCKFTRKLPPDFHIKAVIDDADRDEDTLWACDEDPEEEDGPDVPLDAPAFGLLQKRRHTYCCPARE